MTMPRLAALSVALLALLIALPAPALAAFPVPSGGFSQPGFPQFAAGFWASVDPAVASVAFYSTAGYASQMDLNKTLISSLGYAKTFQCADNGTFVSIVTSRTVNPMTLQPVDEDYCLTGRIYPMGNFMVYAAIPVSAGFCADATDLSAIPVPVTQGAARQAIPPAPALPAGAIAGVYARIGNATVTTCSNTPGIAITPPKITVTLPTTTPCGNYSNPNGPGNTQGVWMDVTNPTTALLEMKNAYGSVTGGLDPTAIAATSGLYVTSECTDASTSKAVSGAITISLAGNVTSQWVCNAATRNDTAGTLTLTSLNSNTINVFQNIRALPGNPDTTCPVTPTPSPSPSPTPEPSPSPEPSANTCTYRGIWRISPLYSPCNKVYLSYNAHACEAKSNVTLMTETVQGSTGYSATLGLDHSVKDGKATAAPIVATNVYDDCAADKLDVVGESGAVQPQLSSADFNWKIVPFKRSCFEVNLISDAPATKGKFLAVPNTCKSFAWASKDGGRARFKLTMVSELPSTTTPTPSNGNIIVG